MAIPDTNNQPTGFITDRPDWDRAYQFQAVWDTFIKAGFSGAEQRTRRRFRPKYRIAYVTPALSVAEYSIRRARSILDTARAVAVPCWHYWREIAPPLTIDADVVTIDVDGITFQITGDMGNSPFKVGSYAFIEQDGLPSVFCKIVDISADVLTLAAGDCASPAIPFPDFTEGATVYPCILGMPTDDSVQYDLNRVNDSDLTVAIDEL